MATPIMTFRVRSDQQDAVRKVVNSIKNDAELTASVLDHIRSQRASGQTDAGGEAPQNLGPFRSEAAAISFLVTRLRIALRPEAILLFGSRASGTHRSDSDFDLLVVLPNDGSDAPDYYSAYAPVAGCGIGIDIVPCSMDDFEADRHVPGTISHTAERDGRLLYARPGHPIRERYRGHETRS